MTEIAATFKHIPSISLQSFQQRPSRARIHKKIRFLGKFFLPSLLSASCAMHEASHNHVSRKFDGPPPRNHQCGSSVPRCRPEIAGPRGQGERSAALDEEQRNHRKPRPPRPRVCTAVQVRRVPGGLPRPRLALPQASIRSPVVVAVSFCKVFSTLRSSEPSTFTLAMSARARCTESVAWARARKDMGRSAAVATVWQHKARRPGTKLTLR